MWILMKVAVGQFGAPTAVLNASLYGVLRTLDDAGVESYGAWGGPNGLIEDHFIPLSGLSEKADWLLHTPGAALLSGRQAQFEAVIEKSVNYLRQRGFDALITIGGNGTMGLALDIERQARRVKYPLQVVGIPKTIDNDLVGIDHSPGFPSAAQFVIKAVRDLTVDLEAMVGFEQVRVVEVMGRHSGWLAAAAVMVSRLRTNNFPDGSVDIRKPIICLPEQPLDMTGLLQKVQRRVCETGTAVVVVSEGVQDTFGREIVQAGVHGKSSASYVLGGVGAMMAKTIRENLGYGTRYENLGMLQRCWADSQTRLDREEARFLGQLGARAILDGKSGIMVGLIRNEIEQSSRMSQTLSADLGEPPPWRGGDELIIQGNLAVNSSHYAVKLIEVPLSQVAGHDRRMSIKEQELGTDFLDWLAPLVDIDALFQHPRLLGEGTRPAME